MSRKADIKKLIEHELWANQKVMEMALSAHDLPDRVGEIVSHLINAQQIWMSRLLKRPQSVQVWGEVPSEKWLKMVKENSSLLLEILEKTDQLDEVIEYSNSKGTTFRSTVSEILYHLVLHSQYHRGQVVVLMKPYVSELPATDFIFWSREKG
ncbi:DinB family protein [Halocola ammonii]